jgi:hypothetical protein
MKDKIITSTKSLRVQQSPKLVYTDTMDNSMEQTPFWEVRSHSTGQEILHILWN